MFTLEHTIRIHPLLPAWNGEQERMHFFTLRDKREAALAWLHGNRRAMDNRVAFCTRIVRRQIAAIERDIAR